MIKEYSREVKSKISFMNKIVNVHIVVHQLNWMTLLVTI